MYKKILDAIINTSFILVFSLCFFLSAIRYPLFAAFYADGNKSKKAIALTFDDGPGGETPKILDILDQYQVKATFFMSGDQVEMRHQIALEVKKRGHEIGDHTYSHINFYAYAKKNSSDKTQAKIRDEIKKSKEIIEKTTGEILKICRMPYGYYKPWMESFSKEFGYTFVNWTFGEDWTNVTAEKMAQDYITHIRPGSILLFHDGGKNRKKTIECVPQVIQKAKENGYSFLTISEIIQ